jgi:hypothetical protein
MTRTAVKSVTPFTFRSDFQAPAPERPDQADTVALSANELAELLANARNEGMAAADARHDKETANKLTAMSVQLNAALEQLLKLAHCLDASALPPETETDIKQLLTAACAHIVNGQGDLFADQ